MGDSTIKSSPAQCGYETDSTPAYKTTTVPERCQDNESTLSRDARLLYAYLMSGLTANPPSTVQTAQQDLGLSRGEIDSLLAELESYGLIAIENRNVGGTEQPTVTMLYQVSRAKGGR